jgi:hypothetical protein
MFSFKGRKNLCSLWICEAMIVRCSEGVSREIRISRRQHPWQYLVRTRFLQEEIKKSRWTAYIQCRVIFLLRTLTKLMTSQPPCISWYISVTLTLPFTFVKRFLVYSGPTTQRQAKIIPETTGYELINRSGCRIAANRAQVHRTT